MQDKHNSNGFYDLYHNPFTGNSEPRGYTYVAGYGFSPPPRADYERRMIRTYSSGIAMMLLCFLLLSGPVYQLILTLETMLFGQIMTYDGYTAAAEIANMGAYVLALLLPAFLHGCYDFIATMESMHYGWLFVGFVAILFLIAFLLVKRQSKHDRYINNYDAEYL